MEKFTTKEEKEYVEGQFTILQKTFGEFRDDVNKDVEEYNNRLENIVESNIQIQVNNRFEQYDRVTNNFKQFFDQSDLGELLDRKADLELIRRINNVKADKTELSDYNDILDGFNHKIRHISVFTSELALMLMPEKETGKFTNQNEL